MMSEINFDFSNNNKHVHFIGIGGISMSGLAELLISFGFTISGSDSKSSALTDKLAKLGAKIYIVQSADNITKDTDIVVATAAIHPDNPELKRSRELGIPVMSRAELLGQVMKLYSNSIAVAGTHGKTTTTSMLSEIFLSSDSDPTISVGGILKSIGGNFRIGSTDLFLTEACEYTNSFLSFFPTVEIILNIDADHLDFFKDIDDIRNSFKKFANLLPENGNLVINSDIPNIDELIKDLKCNVITFGHSNNADYSATDIIYDEKGYPSFTLLYKGNPTERYSLSVPGEHNVYNALSAIATAKLFNIDSNRIAEGLKGFKGTDRRFEYKGELNGFSIIDDYAHHPTEIMATINAAAKYPHNRLFILFQPHTYSRTKSLLNEFADVLSKADNVLLVPIYAARETDDLGISSEILSEEINKLNGNSLSFKDFDSVSEYILKNLSKSDLLITMGAGDVVTVGENLLKNK